VRPKRILKKTFPYSMSTHTQVGSICDKGANVMEVTMSQLVAELEELCQLRPSLDFNNMSRRHQLNSFELFFLVVGSLVVGVLLGVVGVACFKRQCLPNEREELAEREGQQRLVVKTPSLQREVS